MSKCGEGGLITSAAMATVNNHSGNTQFGRGCHDNQLASGASFVAKGTTGCY